jgi:adenylate kinase family enzyme
VKQLNAINISAESASDLIAVRETANMLKTPFTSLVVGPSGSGKTHLVNRIVQSFPPNKFSKIILVYRSNQSTYTDLKKICEIKKTPLALIKENELPEDMDRLEIEDALFIVDDCTVKISKKLEEFLESIFTRLSHHKSISCFYLTQMLFNDKNPFLRTLNRNAHYIIYFRYPRDTNQLKTLIQQMAGGPKKAQIMIQAIMNELKEPHAYILFDFRQETPENHRIRGNILGEKPPHLPWALAYK